MVRVCVCCKRKNNKNGEHLPLYGLPKDITLKKLWLNAIGAGIKVRDSARVCLHHFKDEDFRYSIVGEKPFLKPGAVPSLYLDGQFEKNVQPAQSLDDTQGPIEAAIHIFKQESIDILEDNSLAITDTTNNFESESCNEPLIIRVPELAAISISVPGIKIEPSDAYLKRQRSIEDVRWEEISTSPTQAKIYWEVAVEKIHRQKVRIKSLKQKVKRLRKNVTDLRNTVKYLAKQSTILADKS